MADSVELSAVFIVITLEEAEIITYPSHIVFLLKDPSNIIEDYCNRPDHDDFK